MIIMSKNRYINTTLFCFNIAFVFILFWKSISIKNIMYSNVYKLFFMSLYFDNYHYAVKET